MDKPAYGKLTLITGPMFSGKTTELLRRVVWLQFGQEVPTLVLKPSFDDRYSVCRIVSHDGLSCDAFSINDWKDIPQRSRSAHTVFLDELQFFEKPYFFSENGIVAEVMSLLATGTNVVANGLDMDWQGNAFPITASFAAMADEIVKRTAHCSVCGRPAPKTAKLIPDEAKVALGSQDVYEPRCNEHWQQISKKTIFVK